jgi:hypothetical protein
VRPDPIPQNGAGFALDPDSTIIATDPYRHDGLNRVYLFEVKTGMPRVLSEKQISGDRLFTHIPWQTGQEFAECQVGS